MPPRDAPKSKYIVKPVKVLCHGGPLDRVTVAMYDWKGPDKVWKYLEGEYVLGEYVREFYKQPKGKPREYFEEITPVYNWKDNNA